MNQRRTSLAITVAAAAVGLWALMFGLANDGWVRVQLPALPWTQDPAAAAFEARLWAVMLVAFALGGLLTGLVLRLMLREAKRREADGQRHVEEMERQIANVDRLIANAREHRPREE